MILLVDGTNVITRYVFGILGKESQYASEAAMLGVLKAAEKAVREVATMAGASLAVICFDRPNTWRREIFPAYKAHRGGSDTSSRWGALFCDWMASGGWRCVDAAGHEADDVVATCTAMAHAAGLPVSVLSSDSDLLALADRAAIYQPGAKDCPRFIRRDAEWIATKFPGCTPARVATWKALVGEPGDNIPGCQGVGPVKAQKIMAEHLTTGAILESGAVDRKTFDLMLTLTTLRADVPLPGLDLPACRIPED
jgi:DNA polymerase-1